MPRSGAARRQQVLQIVQVDPLQTLQSIADSIGVTRERVRQICEQLCAAGAIENLKDLKAKAKADRLEAARKEAERLADQREHRKRIWQRMMLIGQRQRLRHMARINHHGVVRSYHMPGQETVCQFEGCTRSVRARGFCDNHYSRLRWTGALWVQRRSRLICKEEGCFYSVYARNMCHNHYSRYIRKNPVGNGIRSHNKTGFRGVYWHRGEQRWGVSIHIPGTGQMMLGSFDTKEQAARAYDTAARKYLGEKAKLNFPDENIEVVKQPRKIAEKVSGVPGITWDRTCGKWAVRITRNGKKIYAGRFIDMEEAIQAKTAALHAHQP